MRSLEKLHSPYIQSDHLSAERCNLRTTLPSVYKTQCCFTHLLGDFPKSDHDIAASLLDISVSTLLQFQGRVLHSLCLVGKNLIVLESSGNLWMWRVLMSLFPPLPFSLLPSLPLPSQLLLSFPSSSPILHPPTYLPILSSCHSLIPSLSLSSKFQLLSPLSS